MTEVIKAHDHGGTDPASWNPGNPIRWACFGPDCDAVSSSEMHQSLTDWYAEHLAEELEKAGFGDIRGGSAPEADSNADEDYDFGSSDPLLVQGSFLRGVTRCNGAVNCASAWHTHGCCSDRDAATCGEPAEHGSERETRA